MNDAPYTLLLHLIGGQSVTLPCESYEIMPPSVEQDDEGNLVEMPLRLDYTPVEGWDRTLGFLDFRGVVAIEVERSGEIIAAESASADNQAT